MAYQIGPNGVSTFPEEVITKLGGEHAVAEVASFTEDPPL
jgi:hypothetical protein